MARADFRFSYPKRVRFAEIDALGVMFNARYLDYLDIAMTEYYRAIGLTLGPRSGSLIVFGRTAINYRKPIRLDETIDLHVRCARIGTTSFTLAWEFHGAGADDLRCDGESVLVHIPAAGRAPTPVPPAIRALFEAHEQGSLGA